MIFVRGCIIEADKKDSHNDILNKEDIKKINRNLGDIQFDTQHDLEKFEGCRVIENTVYDTEVTIGEKTLNKGSWVLTAEVDNPSVEKRIADGELNGYSLFSYAGGKTSYNDVMDKADVYPIFLSFVKDPANQIPFEVLSEDEYISKSEKKVMADDKKILDKIRELLSTEEQEPQKEDVPEEEAISKEDEPVTEPPKEEGEEEAIEKSEEAPQEEDEAPVEEEAIEKACDEKEGAVEKSATEEISNAEIKELLLEVITLLTPTEEEPVEEEEVIDEPASEEEAKQYIVKQATQKNENIAKVIKESKPRFDLFGRKL